MVRESKDQVLSPRERLGNLMSSREEEHKRSEPDVEGGRRAVVVLFLLTVGLSLLFWAQGRLADWLRSFFGPSTFIISR